VSYDPGCLGFGISFSVLRSRIEEHGFRLDGTANLTSAHVSGYGFRLDGTANLTSAHVSGYGFRLDGTANLTSAHGSCLEAMCLEVWVSGFEGLGHDNCTDRRPHHHIHAAPSRVGANHLGSFKQSYGRRSHSLLTAIWHLAKPGGLTARPPSPSSSS
jgi:hypothetical protein